jgi:hypothetical protein
MQELVLRVDGRVPATDREARPLTDPGEQGS